MEQQILEELKREIVNGYAKKGHPFRYLSLATMNGKQPVQRTVVLRKMRSDLSLVVYTDARSEKVRQIEANDAVSTLFYHPKKLLQLRILGRAQFLESEKTNRIWSGIPKTSRKDYTTLEAPGTPIKNPDHLNFDEANNYFRVVHIIPESIEYLRLKRPHHLRILFTKENGEWTGQFLTP